MGSRGVSALCALLVVSGCYDSRTAGPRDDAGRPGPILDSGRPPMPGEDAGPPPPPPPPPTDELDLLFMIDNSGSMTEEQVSLAAGLPALMNALATGDFDGDGAIDGRAFESIQVGVVTSDMGTGGFTVPTCARADFGDDGILRTRGRTDIPGCAATYPPILSYTAFGGTDPVDFAFDVACVANVGTGGCGFEQPLEAVLKAITPTRVQSWTATGFVPVGTAGAPGGLDRPFFRNTPPHGDVANSGLVRDDSILAVVMLTDEEDCSAHDPELFNPSSPTYSATDLNLRCFAHGESALHPFGRYVRGLLQLRRHPSRLAFLPIAGIPVDLEPAPGRPIPWDRLVGSVSERDPRMVEQVDPSMPNRLVPSCNVAGRGIAFPPIRILQAAQGLEAAGARVAVGSICQETYSGALTTLLRALSR